MRGLYGPRLQLELNVIVSYRIGHYCITYGFSGAAVLIRPGSVQTPHNWMKVKR